MARGRALAAKREEAEYVEALPGSSPSSSQAAGAGEAVGWSDEAAALWRWFCDLAPAARAQALAVQSPAWLATLELTCRKDAAVEQ
eukprot:3432086-Prymnesium_polylepis.1